MRNNYALITIFILIFIGSAFAQRPQGPPGAGGPQPRDGRPMGDNGPNGPQKQDWTKSVDTDKNGTIDATEFQAAVERSFAEFDKNGDGVISANEIQRPPRNNGDRMPPMGGNNRPQGPPMGGGVRPQGPPMGGGMNNMNPQGPPIGPMQGPDDKKMLPPFFFIDRVQDGIEISRADFERIVRSVFTEMDKNGDGVLNREESRQIPKRPGEGPRPEGPPMPPNAKFIGAELRFGDKLVKGQPFSAETVIEDNRRLFDGATVTKQSKGAFYRDGMGRTRREQPLENVGGFNIVGDNSKAQVLVFINDFASRSQYFLDLNNKVARKSPIGERPPFQENDGPPDAKTESLGTKMIEGVSVEGTRTTFEIPAGQLGNEKPIQVISERWFSPDLQVVVMSRHLDPLAGEHIFKLVNIKRSEPAADLFTIPTGFRIENQPERKPEL